MVFNGYSSLMDYNSEFSMNGFLGSHGYPVGSWFLFSLLSVCFIAGLIMLVFRGFILVLFVKSGLRLV